MGLLDGLFSFFSLVDGSLGVGLSQEARLVAWGVMASVASMSVYAFFSSQKKLVTIKHEISTARTLLMDYDGAFSEIWEPVKKLISLSFSQVGYSLLPSMAGAIPVVLMVLWIGPHFNYGNLNPGELTQIKLYPEHAFMAFESQGSKKIIQGTGSFPWPDSGEAVKLVDEGGVLVGVLPLEKALPRLEKYKWWNALFTNPNGYIPESALIDKIKIGFPVNRFFPFGPDWMGRPEAVFFLSLLISSLIIKVRFKIQ